MADSRLPRRAGQPPQGPPGAHPLQPAEVESRVFERWEQAGVFSPEPEGTRRGELLDRGAAAQRDRRAAHGPRAQRLLPGPVHPPARGCRAAGPSGSSAPTTPASPPRSRSSRRWRRRAPARRSWAARRFAERVWEWRERVRRPDHRAVPAAGRLAGLRRRALHHGRGLRARRARGVRAAVREGPDLPRQLHGQLGPGHALGHLRPGGRAAQRGRHALRDRLPAGVGLGLGDRGHGAPGDDAGRHGHRREPRATSATRA